MASIGRERGAAAVEFALVVPILIALILAIAAFGRAYNIQSSLSMAAREGARSMAIGAKDAGLTEQQTAVKRAVAHAESLIGGTSPGAVTATVLPATCAPNTTVTASVAYTFDFFGFGGFLGIPNNVPMTGKGVMICGG